MTSNGANGHVQKVAIVTGGASGIGLAISQYFVAEGYNVAVFDVNVKDGQAVVAKIASENPQVKIVFKQCDVSSWKSQAEAFKDVYTTFGRIDVVCANAGISEQGAGAIGIRDEEEPLEPNLKIIDVNLSGPIYSVKLAIHYLSKNELSGSSRGLIICTASNACLYAFPTSPLYAATKTGVMGLVRSTAGAIEAKRIQINALAPACIVTNIAPSKELFDCMIVTPMSTVIKGVAQFVSDPSLTGEIAETSGDTVTLRKPFEYVDEDSKTNIEMFWKLGYA